MDDTHDTHERQFPNERHLDLCYSLWVLKALGKGAVIEDESYPEAHDLAERGWIERKFVEGELTWWWTPRGDQALVLGAMSNDADARAN